MTPRALRGLAAGLALLAFAAPPAARAQVTGSADFSRLVAVGDSLTAGFCSSSLVEVCQRTSYPALLFRQTGATGSFEQPLVSYPGIPPILVLRDLAPLVITPEQGLGNPLNLHLPRPYNNLAVPGADAQEVVSAVTGSPLADLILRGLGSQLQQALALQPTFAIVWVGSNDVLAAATSGRVIEGVTLTPVAVFETAFRTLTDAFASRGVEMAIANLPDVTSIPFVTTLPTVVINPQTNQPVLINGQPVPLIGPQGPLGPGDRVLLTAQAELAQGRGIPAALGGTGQPLSDAAVLSAAEIATIAARVDAFNAIIASVAAQRGAALIDINSTLRRLSTTGVNIGGISYTSRFLTGGIFSYDGVHPNTFGYAFVANLFIDAINDTFDATIPLVNLNPFVFGAASASQGGRRMAPAPAATGQPFYFSPQAWAGLRKALGIPSDAELDRAAKQAKRPRPNKPRRGGKG